jgi:hypothetical protein
MGDWATTFDDREGTKALTIKLIARSHTIAMKRHSACDEASLLRPPPQKMRRSKTFVSSWREATLGCAARQSTLLIAEATTKTSCPHITERNV